MLTQLTPQAKELILAVAGEWVNEKRMFTIYEAVVEARQRGDEADPKVDVVPYRHIKAAVQLALVPFLSAGDYLRNLQDVGAPEMAFVYYPQGADPAQYVPMQRNDAQPVAADPVAADSVVAGPDALGVTFTAPVAAAAGPAPLAVTAEGRLNISSHIIKAAGFKTGDTVYVLDADPANETKQPCAVLLSKKGDAKPVTEYKIGEGCRLRVTNAILQMCGLTGDNYDIDGGDGKIVIKQK